MPFLMQKVCYRFAASFRASAPIPTPTSEDGGVSSEIPEVPQTV